MLSNDGITARYILAFCFFFLSGSTLITGIPAAVSGILGTVELSCALLRYSPLNELIDYRQTKLNSNMKNNSAW